MIAEYVATMADGLRLRYRAASLPAAAARAAHWTTDGLGGRRLGPVACVQSAAEHDAYAAAAYRSSMAALGAYVMAEYGYRTDGSL